MPEGIPENLPPKKPIIRVLEEKSVTHESLGKETKVGEQKEGVPLVFFNDGIFKDMMGHLRGDLNNERGGFLIGHTKQDKTSIEVTGFIPATSSQNRSGVRFEFAHDDWVNFHKVRESRGRGETVVGWVHSHPNIEPAPSHLDDFITQNYFTIPAQFSLIIDPVNNALGVFRCREGKSINEGGIVLNGDLSGNGLNQMPRVTNLNSLSETLPSFSQATSAETTKPLKDSVFFKLLRLLKGK